MFFTWHKVGSNFLKWDENVKCQYVKYNFDFKSIFEVLRCYTSLAKSKSVFWKLC